METGAGSGVASVEGSPAQFAEEGHGVRKQGVLLVSALGKRGMVVAFSGMGKEKNRCVEGEKPSCFKCLDSRYVLEIQVDICQAGSLDR